MHAQTRSILCFVFLSVTMTLNGQSQTAISQPSSGSSTAADMWASPDTAPMLTPVAPAQPVVTTVQPVPASAPLATASVKQEEPRQLTATAPTQNQNTATTNSFIRTGIGFQLGVRFHQPKQLNTFVTDIWNATLSEHLFVPADKKSIFPGALLSLNGTIDIGSYFQIAPFAQGMWAGNQFYFRGATVKDIHINTYTAMGGLNLWARLVDFEKATIRLGAGGYGAYTIARVTGDISGIKLNGSGYGVRGLVGTEIRVCSNIVVTVDCSVPYGVSKLVHQSGELSLSRKTRMNSVTSDLK